MVANTLAYHGTTLITAIKVFTAQVQGLRSILKDDGKNSLKKIIEQKKTFLSLIEVIIRGSYYKTFTDPN
jgi:hypothetical protein